MAINGVGWLIVAGLLTHKLETLRTKIGGGDVKWLAVLSGAAMLGVFGYLNSGPVVVGGGPLIAAVVGAVSMALLLVLVRKTKRLRRFKEYTLGIAMILGMIAAGLYAFA
jgi:Flp pilus assembly protein TadB